MMTVSDVITRVLLVAAILLLLTFLIARFAMSSLIRGAQSAFAIAILRKPNLR